MGLITQMQQISRENVYKVHRMVTRRGGRLLGTLKQFPFLHTRAGCLKIKHINTAHLINFRQQRVA